MKDYHELANEKWLYFKLLVSSNGLFVYNSPSNFPFSSIKSFLSFASPGLECGSPSLCVPNCYSLLFLNKPILLIKWLFYCFSLYYKHHGSQLLHMYLMSLADPWEIYGILRASSKFPVAQMVESPCNAGDPGSIPGFGRSPGKGNGNPLQYSCLENPMDGGAWWVTVHGGAKSWTWLSN